MARGGDVRQKRRKGGSGMDGNKLISEDSQNLRFRMHCADS